MTTLALIGTGVVGERIINQALKLGTYDIVGIFDENTARMEKLAATYNLPTAASLEALLDLTPDWVYIGTPPVSHAPLTEKIAARGLHVLSEKPLAHDASDGEKMVAAVQAAGVKSAMNFPLMYGAAVQKIRDILEAQELGEITRIELHTHFPHWPRPWQQNPWIATREQGGFIREIFPHYLQLTNHLFGGINIIAHDTTYPEDSTRCETSVAAFAKTDAGIPVVINGMSGAAQIERIDYKIFGTKKMLSLRNWGDVLVSEADAPEVQLELGAEKQLLEAVANDGFVVTFEEGLKVQQWIDELLK